MCYFLAFLGYTQTAKTFTAETRSKKLTICHSPPLVSQESILIQITFMSHLIGYLFTVPYKSFKCQTSECRVSQNVAAQEGPAVGQGAEPGPHMRLQSWDQGNKDVCHGNQGQRCICFQSFIILLTFLSLFFLTSLLKYNCFTMVC